MAQASVRNEVTDSAIVESLKEINRIKTELVDAEMLKNAKSKFAGDFVLRLESPSTIASYALNVKTNDLPKDFYENFLSKINAVTAEDIKRVANKYYQTDNMRIVVAGKASDIAENLEKIEWKGKTIPVKYYNKLGEPIAKPVKKELDPAITADAIFSKYIESIGGKDSVMNIESMVMIAQAEIQSMKLDLNMKKTSDGKLSQSISMNGNVMNMQVFDGTTGYVMAQGQKMPYNEEQIAMAKTDAQIFPELNAENAKVSGIEKVNGEDAYVVEMDESNKNFYSVESGLKVKSVKSVSQAGQTMTIPTLYSDYKEVDGVKFPFMISQSMGPQSFEFKVSEILVNEGIEEGDFATE